MARGVRLGMLLFCLVQAEHICCLFTSQAQSLQRQNGNTYAGFYQQDGRPTLGGSYPQDQLRQAPAQSRSLSTGAAQAPPQPAHSGHVAVKTMQSTLFSKPGSQRHKVNQMRVQKEPNVLTGPSSSISSGASLSKYKQNQNGVSKSMKGTWLPQEATPRASQYQSSSSAFLQSPRETFSFRPADSHQSEAQEAPAARTPAYYRPGGSPPVKSSSLFSASASAPEAPRVQTSATVRATRVMKQRGSSRFSHQGIRPRTNPSQSTLFSGNGGTAVGSYQRSSPSRLSGYSQSLPESSNNALFDFRPKSLESSSQRWHHGYSSPRQGSLLAPQNRRGASGLYAPTRTYSIPQQFGGSPIRRLRDPVDQREVSVRKPYAAPSQQRQALQPPAQSVQSPWN